MSEQVDMVLTEEMKEKLKGVLGFQIDSTFPYVPIAYREKNGDGKYIVPKELWPVFTLKSKNGIEVAKAEDNAGYVTMAEKQDAKIFMTGGAARLDTLRKGVKAWKNWRDESGILIPFDERKDIQGGQLSDAKMKMFKVDLQKDLQNAINERSTLSPEELQGLE